MKWSTRDGTFITLSGLMDKVGVDVARYLYVMIKPDSHMVFNLDLARSRSLDNPVYYLQYANARITSIFRFAAREGYPDDPGALGEEIDLGCLEEEEMTILRGLSFYPSVVYAAGEHLEPHRLTSYLEDLTSSFHHWYERRRVVENDRQVTLARLYLCHGVRVVLQAALKLLGVTVPDRM